MASKVKKISYFIFVFAFSFLAGSIFFFFENYGFLSLRGYIVEAPSADIEKRFWDSLPPECIRYWPVLVYKSREISVSMEKAIPVQVLTEAKGIGLFYTRISYLEPWLMVEWRGNVWYLSKEGYMWAPELFSFEVPKSPHWSISDTLNRYFGIEKSEIPDGVFTAMFSIEEIKRFDGILRVQSWYANTKHVEFDRRAGEFVLRLSLDLNGRKILILINGEDNKLSEIDMLLKQIMPQIDFDDKVTFIDMSYTDKVVVTRAREGSLK